MRGLRKNVVGLGRNRVFTGTIASIIGSRVTVDMGGGRMVRGIPLIGGPVIIGQVVEVDYSNGPPVARTHGKEIIAEPVEPEVVRPSPTRATDQDGGGDGTTGSGGIYRVSDILWTPVTSADINNILRYPDPSYAGGIRIYPGEELRFYFSFGFPPRSYATTKLSILWGSAHGLLSSNLILTDINIYVSGVGPDNGQTDLDDSYSITAPGAAPNAGYTVKHTPDITVWWENLSAHFVKMSFSAHDEADGIAYMLGAYLAFL